MLSLFQIQRMINQRQFPQLVSRILANGRCEDRRIIERLLQPQNVMCAGLALSLQRVVELTYRPTAVAEALACRLLDQQRGDGLFGSAGDELALTALAFRALSNLARQHGLAGQRLPRRIEVALDLALDQALAALTLRQDLEHQLGCDPIDRDIVAWQLQDDPAISAALFAMPDAIAGEAMPSSRTRAA